MRFGNLIIECAPKNQKQYKCHKNSKSSENTKTGYDQNNFGGFWCFSALVARKDFSEWAYNFNIYEMTGEFS